MTARIYEMHMVAELPNAEVVGGIPAHEAPASKAVTEAVARAVEALGMVPILGQTQSNDVTDANSTNRMMRVTQSDGTPVWVPLVEMIETWKAVNAR